MNRIFFCSFFLVPQFNFMIWHVKSLFYCWSFQNLFIFNNHLAFFNTHSFSKLFLDMDRKLKKKTFFFYKYVVSSGFRYRFYFWEGCVYLWWKNFSKIIWMNSIPVFFFIILWNYKALYEWENTVKLFKKKFLKLFHTIKS